MVTLASLIRSGFKLKEAKEYLESPKAVIADSYEAPALVEQETDCEEGEDDAA